MTKCKLSGVWFYFFAHSNAKDSLLLFFSLSLLLSQCVWACLSSSYCIVFFFFINILLLVETQLNVNTIAVVRTCISFKHSIENDR